jgi:hypothetical protein
VKGIENSLLWGSQGESLYGLLQETPNSTLIWIEYSAAKDWAFSHFRGVLINFANAIMKSQRKLGRITRNLTVKDSNLYVENENDSLGVTVRIMKEAKLLPGITLKESFISGAVAALAIYGHYQTSNKDTLQYLSEMQFSSLPIPVYGWFMLMLWGTLTLLINLCTRQVEVKFDA